MPRYLLAAGAALLLLVAVLALIFRPHHPSHPATSVTVSLPAHTTTAATTTTAPPPVTTTALPPPPPTVAMSWQSAGGLVVHTDSIDPAQLGQEMRDAGFGWLALDLAHFDLDWVNRFRAASGLPVGGWSVLGEDAAADAQTAVQAVRHDGLSFFIADAESPYGYTQRTTLNSAAYARSRQFVDAFRAAEPALPAAVSSYCRPDEHDLDWSTWADAGFDFLPQAYVNDFGPNADPAACVSAATKWFLPSRVHPTVASYHGVLHGFISPAEWIPLLRAAHTTGFSVYPAEVNMSPQDWQAYAAALPELAHKPS